MKILKYLFVILLFLLIIHVKVNALDIENVGEGNNGETSSTCNTGVCGNTVGLFSFGNTAIYGMRVSLVDDSGNVVDGKVANFWANDNMNNVIGSLTNIKKSANNNYSNYSYIVNNDYKLYNFKKNGKYGLREIDSSGATYSDFIDDMNIDDVSFIMGKFNYKINDAITKGYLLKIEPIFVLHYHIDYDISDQNPGKDYYFQGNVKEILDLTYDLSKTEWGVKAVAEINFVSGREGQWNVIRNFILTVYLNKSYKNLTYYNGDPNKESTEDLYNNVRGDKSGLAVGYIAVSDFKNKSSDIVITKRMGDPNDSSLKGKGYFQLLRYNSVKNKYEVYTNDGFTYHYNPYNPDSDKEDEKKQQVTFKNIPEGSYRIREIKIADDIGNVYFRQKDNAGNYSIVMDDSQGISYLNDDLENVIISKQFKVEGGNKLYFTVYNKEYDEPSNDNATISISKYFKKTEYDESSRIGYAKFILEKETQSGFKEVTSIKKLKNSKKDIFFNIEEKGKYRIWEVDIYNYDTVEVLKTVGNDAEDPISGKVTNHRYVIDTLDVELNNAYKYTVTNISKNGQTCDTILSSLKTDLCENNKSCSEENKIEFINRLWKLYDDYSSDDYNMLFNYKFNNNSLDINGVKCSNYKCQTGSNLECTSGNFNMIDDSVENRVCLLGAKFKSNNTLGFYNDDLKAYCYISFDYTTDFKYETLKNSFVLWESIDPKIGTMNYSVTCENLFGKDVDLSNYELNSDQFIDSDYFPTDFSISWKSYNKNYEQTLKLDNVDEENDNSKFESICDNNFCYAFWSDNYLYDIKYAYRLYNDDDSGGSLVNKKNGNNYSSNPYYGLSLNFNDSKGEKNATLKFKFNKSSYETTCPYNLDGDYDDDDDDDDDDDYDFKFRIIDTDNPFPGINNEGRTVGYNWCLDSNIGLIKEFDTSTGEKTFFIGDLNGDEFIDDNDIKNIEFDKLNLSDNPYADIDGDGQITFSENCIDSTDTDNCILTRYLNSDLENINLSRKNNCKSDNYIVNKYIVNQPNSRNNDKPMYSFTLNSSDIKNIREYNKSNSYDKFNLKCSNGVYCLSDFLTEWIKNGKVNNANVSHKMSSDDSRCYQNRISNSTNKMVWCNNIVN